MFLLPLLQIQFCKSGIQNGESIIDEQVDLRMEGDEGARNGGIEVWWGGGSTSSTSSRRAAGRPGWQCSLTIGSR